MKEDELEEPLLKFQRELSQLQPVAPSAVLTERVAATIETAAEAPRVADRNPRRLPASRNALGVQIAIAAASLVLFVVWISQQNKADDPERQTGMLTADHQQQSPPPEADRDRPRPIADSPLTWLSMTRAIAAAHNQQAADISPEGGAEAWLPALPPLRSSRAPQFTLFGAPGPR